MSKRKVLTENEKQLIIDKYTNETLGVESLSKLFKVGKLKIKDVLKENGIEIKKRGGQNIGVNSSDLESSNIKIYKSNDDNIKLVAVCKKTGIKFNDVNNLSGTLTNHIVNEYGNVDIPTNTYQRKKYEQMCGKKWFEEYFDIVEEEKPLVRKCKICDWTTTDIDNKTGCFVNHIKKEHNLNIDKYLKKFPKDIKYHPTYVKNEKRNNILKNKDNFVICQICYKKMKTISNSHLKKHNITAEEYKNMYGNKLMSKNLITETTKRLNSYNLDGKTKGKPSKPEKELCELLDEYNVNYVFGDRKILNGKEIDILIKDNKIGIEYNGNIHHTEFFGGKVKNYHLNKTILANQKGFGLIHIFSDEWINNKELIKNKIKHIINVSDAIKIGARKCNIIEIDTHTKNNFLNKYHIQGEDSSTVKLGCFYKNILVGIMTFKYKNEYQYELSRYATNYGYIIMGLGSKMLKYFIKKYKPKNIISFADRRWTIDKYDNLYTKMGFKLVKILNPDYKYYYYKDKNEFRKHKFSFRKQKLIKKYPKLLNENMTETEMIKKLGYDRIWDCGLFKYELNL